MDSLPPSDRVGVRLAGPTGRPGPRTTLGCWPADWPFLESLSWFDTGWRDLSPLDALRRYESGWRNRGVTAEPSAAELVFIAELVRRYGSVIDVSP